MERSGKIALVNTCAADEVNSWFEHVMRIGGRFAQERRLDFGADAGSWPLGSDGAEPVHGVVARPWCRRGYGKSLGHRKQSAMSHLIVLWTWQDFHNRSSDEFL